MQNTFSQSGNDSKWFLRKIIFQNRYVALETPPLHGKYHLKFPFWLLAPFPKAVLSYLLPPQEVIVKHDHSKLMCIGCKTLAILCWYLWSWWWPRTVTLCGKFLQRKREGDDIFGVGDKTSWKHPGAQIWVISGHIWGWGQNILKRSCPDIGHLRSSLRKKLANMRIFCSINIINGQTKSQN